MKPRDPSDVVRQRLVAEDRSGAPSVACLDDETIAALADGTLEPNTRAAVLPHLSACSRCRHVVASVSRALADPTVRHEVIGTAPTGGRRWYRLALPLAAAAALVFLLWPARFDDGSAPHRAPPVGPTSPVPVAPVGAVTDAKTLTWTAVTRADRYRVTLSDAEGRILFEAQLVDTEATLPDSIVLVPRRLYAWMVEARTAFDRWSPARLVEFSITAGAVR